MPEAAPAPPSLSLLPLLPLTLYILTTVFGCRETDPDAGLVRFDAGTFFTFILPP